MPATDLVARTRSNLSREHQGSTKEFAVRFFTRSQHKIELRALTSRLRCFTRTHKVDAQSIVIAETAICEVGTRRADA